MISDEERREAARRLRMSRSEWSGMCWKLWLGPKFGAVVLSDGNRDELEDTAHRLADLIDPTCLARADVEDTPDGGQFECWSCSVCGNIVSVNPDYDTETDGPAYCEACGHRIVGKGEPTWL